MTIPNTCELCSDFKPHFLRLNMHSIVRTEKNIMQLCGLLSKTLDFRYQISLSRLEFCEHTCVLPRSPRSPLLYNFSILSLKFVPRFNCLVNNLQDGLCTVNQLTSNYLHLTTSKLYLSSLNLFLHVFLLILKFNSFPTDC